MSYDINTKAAQQFAAQQFAYNQQCETAVASGYSSCDAVPSALMGEVASKLETLGNITGDTCSILGSLSDRLFGSAPRTAQGSSAANKPMGQAAELVSILEVLIDRARYARDEAAQLNSRI